MGSAAILTEAVAPINVHNRDIGLTNHSDNHQKETAGNCAPAVSFVCFAIDVQSPVISFAIATTSAGDL